jgi:N-acylglucosamine 2-epimerase
MPPDSPSEGPDASTLTAYRKTYEAELFERVIPFWAQYAPDRTHGGYHNCLDRTGTPYDTTKHAWMQGRQAWMFSTLYRDVEPRDEWLAIARLGVTFLREHALRPNGQVFFSLTEDGQPIYQQRKIFSECFYVMALASYGHAAGRDDLLQEARDELALIWEWAYDWSQVGRPVHEGQPEAQQLAVPMILLNLIEVVSDGGGAAYRAEVDACIRRIRRHVDWDTECVFEHVRPDGSRLDGAEGRLLNPGHAIEAGWFLHHWATHLHRPDLRDLATTIIRWSYETGWDDKHGGLFYFLDAEGYAPVQLEWFMKLWWPHTEALYAHLLNYAATGAQRDWAAFEEVHAYTFDHFPDSKHGGWFGYLDRQGGLTHSFKGAPYKGCFHVPRSLWLCWRRLQAMEQQAVDGPSATEEGG